ncbi:MAG TPA: formate dehydrogenase [Thermodesulfobacteriota bacterium]|mgnify:FL=1|nr:formate dehydrogenase [Thermodesulfobacteriota bacterium]
MPKAFFIDTTRCTACRGCQVACKEWKELPASQTKQTGSHQNPPDLDANTLKVVRFHEYRTPEGKVVWNFFSDQCRHCLEPPCRDVGNEYANGSVVVDGETGAVTYTDLIKNLSDEQFDELQQVCPYQIPRRDQKTKMVMKCDMCIDRVKNGLLPMCAKACPTKAINFGERDEMLALAQQRLDVLKKEFPEAQLLDADFFNVIYLITDKPELYNAQLVAHASFGITRKQALAKLLSPFRTIQSTINS